MDLDHVVDEAASLRRPHTRRDFVHAAGIGGAGFILPGILTGCADESRPFEPAADRAPAALEAWSTTADAGSCDIISQLELVGTPRADALSRALAFMCLDPLPRNSPTLAAEMWNAAHTISMDAIGTIYPSPLAAPARILILGEPVALEFTPLPTYAVFRAREAELCSLVCDNDQDSPLAKILRKIFSAIGFSLSREQWTAFFALFGEFLGRPLDNLLQLLKRREFRNAWRAFWAILDALLSNAFSQRLARAVGRAAATQFFAKLGAKLLPWVGWGLLIGSLIYEFAVQIA